MNLLFKASVSGNDGEIIVKFTNFKQHYSGVNDNMSWDTLSPCIRKATEKYIIPVIGQELYDDIAQKFTDGDALNETKADFLRKLQDAVAYYTIYHGGPELNISISDMGLGEKGASGSAVYPTAQWRYKNFMWDVCRKADELLDALIVYLDKMVADEDSYFDLWEAAPGYVLNKTSFFNSAEIFSRYQAIGSSRKLFNAIYQDIVDAEEKVKMLICSDQFDDLETKIKADSLDADEAVLVNNIRKYVAAKALANGVPRLTIYLDGSGLFLSSFSDGFDSKGTHASAFKGAEAVGGFAIKIAADADRYFENLVNYIYQNIASFPLIQNSDCYSEYDPDSVIPVCVGAGGVML